MQKQQLAPVAPKTRFIQQFQTLSWPPAANPILSMKTMLYVLLLNAEKLTLSKGYDQLLRN